MAAAAKASASGRRRRAAVRAAAVVPRHGSAHVAEIQRARMLSSAVQVVAEHGYGQMSVSRVTDRAGVSRRTFYDLFEDREDCFLAVFDDAIVRAGDCVRCAYEGGGGGSSSSWRGCVRAGLEALLGFFEEEPGVCSLLVVDALKAGPRVQRLRAEILAQVAGVLQRDGVRAGSGRRVPPLTGEGVVGAVLGVLHARLLSGGQEMMRELASPLMAMIVLPYLGPGAAQKELERAVEPAGGGGSRDRGSVSVAVSSLDGVLQDLPMRLTYRTLRVLSAIAEQPGASNRIVSETAGVSDQGQISKLLARLERLGLVINSGQGQPHGEPNAWRLTDLGEEVWRATHTTSSANAADRRSSRVAPRRLGKHREGVRS